MAARELRRESFEIRWSRHYYLANFSNPPRPTARARMPETQAWRRKTVKTPLPWRDIPAPCFCRIIVVHIAEFTRSQSIGRGTV